MKGARYRRHKKTIGSRSRNFFETEKSDGGTVEFETGGGKQSVKRSLYFGREYDQNETREWALALPEICQSLTQASHGAPSC
jgi:hypothetical protein